LHGSKFKAVPLTANEENLFSPLNVLMNAVRFWWVVFLMMIIGGLVGWLIHFLRAGVRSYRPVFCQYRLCQHRAAEPI
jgi:hypothetical protein